MKHDQRVAKLKAWLVAYESAPGVAEDIAREVAAGEVVDPFSNLGLESEFEDEIVEPFIDDVSALLEVPREEAMNALTEVAINERSLDLALFAVSNYAAKPSAVWLERLMECTWVVEGLYLDGDYDDQLGSLLEELEEVLPLKRAYEQGGLHGFVADWNAYGYAMIRTRLPSPHDWDNEQFSPVMRQWRRGESLDPSTWSGSHEVTASFGSRAELYVWLNCEECVESWKTWELILEGDTSWEPKELLPFTAEQIHAKFQRWSMSHRDNTEEYQKEWREGTKLPSWWVVTPEPVANDR